MKAFCQYSYRGFNVYSLKDECDQLIVGGADDVEKDFELPEEVQLLFGNNCAKMAFRLSSSGQYIFVLCDIVSNEKDTSGNRKPCDLAIVFEKDEDDLAKRALSSIAVNTQEFEERFVDLFSNRPEGLFFSGADFYSIIRDLQKPEDLIWKQLFDVKDLFLVVKGAKFGIDESVTNKVINQLGLGSFEEVRGHYISKEAFDRKDIFTPVNELKKKGEQLPPAGYPDIVELLHNVGEEVVRSIKEYVPHVIVLIIAIGSAIAFMLTNNNDKRDVATPPLACAMDTSWRIVLYSDSAFTHEADTIRCDTTCVYYAKCYRGESESLNKWHSDGVSFINYHRDSVSAVSFKCNQGIKKFVLSVGGRNSSDRDCLLEKKMLMEE